MFGLMRKKMHKRITSEMDKNFYHHIDTLKLAHESAMQVSNTIPREMEEKCLAMMGLMKQRHDIDIKALQQFKARPRQCPHCDKSIQPK